MTEYSNIKIAPETFQELQEQKPEGMTWDLFLRQEVVEG